MSCSQTIYRRNKGKRKKTVRGEDTRAKLKRINHLRNEQKKRRKAGKIRQQLQKQGLFSPSERRRR